MEHPSQRQKGNEDKPSKSVNGITTFFGVDVTSINRNSRCQELTNMGKRSDLQISKAKASKAGIIIMRSLEGTRSQEQTRNQF